MAGMYSLIIAFRPVSHEHLPVVCHFVFEIRILWWLSEPILHLKRDFLS